MNGADLTGLESRFDAVLSAHLAEAIGSRTLPDSIEFDIATITAVVLVSEREAECKTDPGVERYDAASLVTDMAEFGFGTRDSLARTVEHLETSEVLKLEGARLAPMPVAEKLVTLINTLFPGMMGMHFVAFVAQSIEEVVSGRKETELAVESFRQTLQSRSIRISGLSTLKPGKTRRTTQRETGKPASPQSVKGLAKKLESLRSRTGTSEVRGNVKSVFATTAPERDVTPVFGKPAPVAEPILTDEGPAAEGSPVVEKTGQEGVPESFVEVPDAPPETEEAVFLKPSGVSSDPVDPAPPEVPEPEVCYREDETDTDLEDASDDKSGGEAPEGDPTAPAAPPAAMEDADSPAEGDPVDQPLATEAAEKKMADPAKTEDAASFGEPAEPASFERAEPGLAPIAPSPEPEPSETPAAPEPDPEPVPEPVSEKTIAERVSQFEEKLAQKCPVCKEGELDEQETENGKLFFECQNVDCSFVSWSRPYPYVCPTCGNGFLVEFKIRGGGIGLKCPRATCDFRQRGTRNPAVKARGGKRKVVRRVRKN